MAVDRPLLRPRRVVLTSLSLKGGYLRLEFRNGLALTLRLVRELPQTLQDLADEVLGPCVGVHDAPLLGQRSTDIAEGILHRGLPP